VSKGGIYERSFACTLGNNLIVSVMKQLRGAFKNRISVATTYLGRPSSRIYDVSSDMLNETGTYFEFSVNEKVALEVAT
jgi:TPP-dependent indolepyruvate ferredoxin oxidoreductase alpha subunit